jgi:hypothetical protein
MLSVARTSLLSCSIMLGACASGVPAEPPPLASASAAGSGSLVPGVAGARASGAQTSFAGAAAAAGAGGVSGGVTSGTAACQNLACVDVFDCVFLYLGNQCAFTKCESGVCR